MEQRRQGFPARITGIELINLKVEVNATLTEVLQHVTNSLGIPAHMREEIVPPRRGNDVILSQLGDGLAENQIVLVLCFQQGIKTGTVCGL